MDDRTIPHFRQRRRPIETPSRDRQDAGPAPDDDLEHRLERVGALAEPVRLALYRFVASRPDGATRDDAAAVLGIARHQAKFHLDRLVADGALAAEYRRSPGRGGPGAGRPAKRYRTTGDLEVSVPERRYDLAGRLLVRAVARAERTGIAPEEALADVACDAGRVLGEQAAGGPEEAGGRLTAVLASCGFAPARDGSVIVLVNCPFHALAEENRALVCGMNLAFVRGLLDGARVPATAALDARPGRCCVTVRT